MKKKSIFERLIAIFQVFGERAKKANWVYQALYGNVKSHETFQHRSNSRNSSTDAV